jgi:hypothetical protein
MSNAKRRYRRRRRRQLYFRRVAATLREGLREPSWALGDAWTVDSRTPSAFFNPVLGVPWGSYEEEVELAKVYAPRVLVEFLIMAEHGERALLELTLKDAEATLLLATEEQLKAQRHLPVEPSTYTRAVHHILCALHEGVPYQVLRGSFQPVYECLLREAIEELWDEVALYAKDANGAERGRSDELKPRSAARTPRVRV